MSYPETQPVESFHGPEVRFRPKARGAVRQQCNVVYAEALGLGLTMDIFTPEGPSVRRAIIDVVSHRWRGGRLYLGEHMGLGMMDVLCAHGFTVFALGPGSAEQFTIRQMVRHVSAGVRFIRRRAGRFGIDPTQIGVTGLSSGGHLASFATLHPEAGRGAFSAEDAGIQAAALFFPPSNLTTMLPPRFDPDHKHPLPLHLLFSKPEEGQDEEELAARLRKYSPVFHVPESPSPFFLCHGTEDPIVPYRQSETFANALREAGGVAEMLPVKGAGHSWADLRPQLETVAEWFEERLGTA